ncbi:MAG: nitroreductase family deazaflavin-dependent oxidoreductase [Thermomicrobiales bacterium]|nr:nitroreductase family deazaflavin-dependent oxidoreductase [Thermomicrobiales bacterium]
MDPVIEEFRANGGVVGGRFEGRPLLILNTIGAKSGEPRSHALMYGEDGDDLFIIASKGGAPEHPAWYHNLVANPEVMIELGGETYPALATPAEGEERDRLFAAMVARWPFFGEYQRRIDRRIPVVRLSRVQ